MKTLIPTLILLSITLISCNKKKNLTIGFSYVNTVNDWSNILKEEIINEVNLQFNYNIKLIEKEAKQSIEDQRKHLNEFLHSDIDILILFPSDTARLNDLVGKIHDKNIPVILIDRKINTNKYTSIITHDYVELGEKIAYYAANILKNKGSIITISGQQECINTKNKQKGFIDVIKNFSSISIEEQIVGNFIKDSVQNKLRTILNSGYKPDLVFAHNDMIASWAYDICLQYKVFPYIIGVNGLFVSHGGINMIRNGYIDATFYNRPGGDIAIQTVIDIIEGKEVSKTQILETFPIDKQNLKIIMRGINLLDQKTSNISLQRKQLGNLDKRVQYQRLLLIISIVSIILVLAFSLLLYIFLKQKYNYIKLIEQQNNQITSHLEEEQALSEELAKQNDSLERYKNELELLVKERTKKLQVALKKAEESDKLKTSFLSNFSHEVRTPLNSIIGFSNLLAQEVAQSENKLLFIEHIKSGGNQLLKLINDLVEASIVNTEEIKLNCKEFGINKLIEETYNLYIIENKELLKGKSDSVSFIYTTSKEHSITSDFQRFKQLLGYLIDNAIKFTHKGTVELGYRHNFQLQTVRIYVKDTGIGINDKYFGYIFKQFVKLEDEIDVLYRGNGLGLSIAQKLAHFLNTQIQVKSELGKGSCFYIDIPYTNKKNTHSPSSISN